jgi:putative MATE family efflux protein
LDPRTRILLEAPILPTLLRLAIPNVVMTTVQGSIGLIDIYFMAKLGTDAVAGVSLVFPGLMLMQMMAGGAMGGGISSAVARALGSGRRGDADALVLHALLIGAILAAFFSIAMIAAGPWLYALLGGRGAVLDIALTYSNIVFAGVILIWSFNVLANIIRGTGNTLVPAAVTIAGAALLVPLSPCLIFGYGPFPRLGIPGGAIALLIYYGFGTAIYAGYLLSGRSVVRPRLLQTRLRWPLFYDILRIGAVASLIALMTNVTISLTTGLVAAFGVAAIAGYGIGTRLEYMLVPLSFGFGGALVALVGTNIGAGDRERALRAAWIGGWVSFSLTGTIGLSAAIFPAVWLSLFTSDPAMIEAGTAYLRVVGPFYGFFGLGMALYFASQGAGTLIWPLLAGAGRLVIAVGGGWLVLNWTGSLTLVFLTLGLALAVFGMLIALAVARGVWLRGANDSARRSG